MHPDQHRSLQCRLLGLCRSTPYYHPREPDAEELALMWCIDELYTAHPFYGIQQLRRHLRPEGLATGRDRVRRPMRRTELDCVST